MNAERRGYRLSGDASSVPKVTDNPWAEPFRPHVASTGPSCGVPVKREPNQGARGNSPACGRAVRFIYSAPFHSRSFGETDASVIATWLPPIRRRRVYEPDAGRI